MDELEKILNKYEVYFQNKQDKIFELFLDEFENIVGIPFTYCDCENGEVKFLNLKYKYIYTSIYRLVFFELLAKYNYNFRHEILDAIFDLSLINRNCSDVESINKYINSPYIQDISKDWRHRYTIFSDKYGSFSFKLASNYFRNNKYLLKYIKCNDLYNRCHENTFNVSKLLDDYYSVTSLCSRYFDGFYFHSYIYNSNSNEIIDLSYNIVMDKDQYYKLFQPEEVSVILNKFINDEVKIVDNKTDQLDIRCELLRVALYKKYLKDINYDGLLENGPVLKK